jgi:hypothetical protein
VLLGLKMMAMESKVRGVFMGRFLAVAGVDKAVEVQLLGGCVGKAGRCEVKVFDGGPGCVRRGGAAGSLAVVRHD